jgi:uncharacterized membrane protein YvlD (DUF360 family)
MNAIAYVMRWLIRFLILWSVDAISLLITDAIVPGITLNVSETSALLVTAAAAAFMLGIVNLLIRPVILLLTLPLGFFVTFAVGFIVNALALLITSRLLPVFEVSGFIAAFFGGLVLATVNTIITGVLTVDDEDSFYQGVVERVAKRQTFRGAVETGRGLAMMEIDGLSYWHMKHALDAGMLPTLKQMMDEEGYVLSRVDCGLPSQTSACQAGIMFGDNYDIPAFRWYEKDRQKLMVSGSDAAEINARYAHGNGLMRGGSSINNMLDGDAEKSLLTLADLRTGTPDEKSRRARDIYLLAANPYFLMRTVVLMFGDALLEIFQYLRARSRGVEPRLDRLHHFYPMIRAATTVFMRDVAAYLMSLDIIRGAPSIYVTWPGYDEVAHHSGPWSSDAFGVLRRYDRVVQRMRDLIKRKAPRPYDLILLSDHGQSFGATFKQRYGLSLKEFIEQHLPKGMTVSQNFGGDTGIISLQAVSGELDNVQAQGVSGRVGGAVVKQGQKAAQRAVDEREAAAGAAQVVAYGSGNLAQVYFDLHPRRILLSELQAAYPGMVDALVQHEAVGIVCGYADDGSPIVLSKTGRRNLVTSEVTGEDPLKPYGDVELRSWQVRRVMEFPHAGDLMVISTVYPDGTVAALEELIGSHGGMGGEQTDAFIFHPRDMPVGETRNATDVFHILNARRGQPLATPIANPAAPPAVEPWSWANLVHGITRQPSRWVGRALRSLVFDRRAYQEAASDPTMTGPALVVVIVSLLVAGTLGVERMGWLAFPARIGSWLLASMALYGAARLLGGKAEYHAMFRALGFAAALYLLSLLAVIPPIASIVPFIVVVTTFLGAWIAASEAQGLHGWRSLILPVAYVAVFTISLFVLAVLLTGAQMTLTTLAQQFGLTP